MSSLSTSADHAADLPRPGRGATSLAALRGLPPELAVLGLLLVVTGTFGAAFSKVELGPSWLHPTEVVLALIIVAVLVRHSPMGCIARVRATGAAIPLLAFWLFGAIAAIRGLGGWGFDLVLHDIGLVEYSVLAALVATIVTTRRDFLWLCKALALAGALAVAMQAITLWEPSNWEIAESLRIVVVAAGMYFGITLGWGLGRMAAGEKVPAWQIGLLVLGVAVTIIGDARAAWLALVAAVVVASVLAVGSQRRRVALTGAAVLAAGVALSLPLHGFHPDYSLPFDLPFEASEVPRGVLDADGNAGGDANPNAIREITASFDPTQVGAQNANARWRLAFWGHAVEESATRPLGVGFGAPSEFVWQDIRYDFRTGDPAEQFDVTGPHNSFVNILFRTGIGGLIAVVALLVLAAGRVIRCTRATTGPDRALGIFLLAGLAVTTICASFSVALEGPYMAIFFWVLMGLCLIAPGFFEGNPEREGHGRGAPGPVRAR